MAQTYAQFVSYLTSTLWRQNDIDLAAAIDNLIVIANRELDTVLNVQGREVALLIAPETEDFILPADFRQIVSLTNIQYPQGIMANSTLQDVMLARGVNGSSGVHTIYYPQRGESTSTLYLAGPFSALNPGSMVLQYRRVVPDYAVADASWVNDLYPNLYMYTIFKHCAIFLREDERIVQYAGLAQEALTNILDEDKRQIQFGGSPLKMKPHHVIPHRRR
tara:strand:- start:2660 stop:3319 length:660 start_codon:yes stop_codon:yes gene_type:complete